MGAGEQTARATSWCAERRRSSDARTRRVISGTLPHSDDSAQRGLGLGDLGQHDGLRREEREFAQARLGYSGLRSCRQREPDVHLCGAGHVQQRGGACLEIRVAGTDSRGIDEHHAVQRQALEQCRQFGRATDGVALDAEQSSEHAQLLMRAESLVVHGHERDVARAVAP